MWTALPTAANAADAGAGKQLFQDKTCAACHTIGKGPLVGPDLKDVTKRRPHDWLEQWIMAPDAVLAKKDEYAVKLLHEYHDMAMPNLGLSKGDVDNHSLLIWAPQRAELRPKRACGRTRRAG